MSVNEYSADEFTASKTHAAIFILSIHGVFEASALISLIVRIDFSGSRNRNSFGIRSFQDYF
jgi:hypothetical protein